jgi:hypothetical protein
LLQEQEQKQLQHQQDIVQRDLRAMKVLLCMKLGSGCEILNKTLARQALQHWREKLIEQLKAEEAQARLTSLAELIESKATSQPLRHWRSQCSERRLSTDGGAYTRKEFVRFFGLSDGAFRWVEAPVQIFYETHQRRAAVRIQSIQRGIVARVMTRGSLLDMTTERVRRQSEEAAAAEEVALASEVAAFLLQDKTSSSPLLPIAEGDDETTPTDHGNNNNQAEQAAKKDFLKPNRYRKRDEFALKLARLKGRIASRNDEIV